MKANNIAVGMLVQTKIEELSKATQTLLNERPESYQEEIEQLSKINSLLGARRGLQALAVLLINGEDTDWVNLAQLILEGRQK